MANLELLVPPVIFAVTKGNRCAMMATKQSLP